MATSTNAIVYSTPEHDRAVLDSLTDFGAEAVSGLVDGLELLRDWTLTLANSAGNQIKEKPLAIGFAAATIALGGMLETYNVVRRTPRDLGASVLSLLPFTK